MTTQEPEEGLAQKREDAKFLKGWAIFMNRSKIAGF
jgi:hypothetical protein